MVEKTFKPDIIKSKLLLVEGKDEVYFFEKLLSHMQIMDVQVIELSGKTHFHQRFPMILNSKNFAEVTAYAILRDGDSDTANAFQSIADLLSRYGQPVPATVGTFQVLSGKKVGIFILPDGQRTGMLEDLVMEAVAVPQAKACAEQFMECMSQLPVELQPDNKAKSRAKAYLAAMKEDTPSVGIATHKGYWNLDHPSLSPLKEFLIGVFLP